VRDNIVGLQGPMFDLKPTITMSNTTQKP